MQGNQPVLMPAKHWREFGALSKNALLDLVWDYACRCAGNVDGDAPEVVLAELRKSAAAITRERKAVPS